MMNSFCLSGLKMRSCEAAGMRISISKSDAMVLNQKRMTTLNQGQIAGKWMSSSISGFCSLMRRELIGETKMQIGVMSAAMWMKRELSLKAKLLIYVSTISYGHEIKNETVDEMEAEETRFLQRVAGLSLDKDVELSHSEQVE